MRCLVLLACLGSLMPAAASAAEEELPVKAREALHKAVAFFHGTIATEGGYLWRYSEDLSKREGEGKATATQVWVQAPGTPSIGRVLLGAYRATGERFYLQAAIDAGKCLVRGQLLSGGWGYSIEFDPKRRANYAYRVVEGSGDQKPSKTPSNTTTLDDDNTQSALRFLMDLDQTLEFKDAVIHEAVQFGLNAVLAAQYPNGAWPQRFTAPPDPAQFPVKKASYPETWSRTWPKEDYKSYYTLNDNTIADTIDTMLMAAKVYGEARFQAAAEKGGDFLLLAQMPEPQPAWAQQYDAQMHPAWARKFEPPAVTGGESQGAMRILMRLYQETGHKKYLEPIPVALAYLERSRLSDGRLARFYELQTNKPLYFTKDYRLTYDDSDMPTHYAFKITAGLDSLKRMYENVSTAPAPQKDKKESGADEPARRVRKKNSAKALGPQVVKVIAAMDAQGRWVEKGGMRYHGDSDTTQQVIDCHTFIRNALVLIHYLEATR